MRKQARHGLIVFGDVTQDLPFVHHSLCPTYYCRAVCANTDTVNDFFGKLGAIYGRLNLTSKPKQVYNCDETGTVRAHNNFFKLY